ncbi:MAG: biotin/lipoyl-binding protein [Bacteroidales bacterium]|jgi:glutaconyl-CoA decarboxylase|nr:biotin/lipoyl-binding protein [Bacteroidales bacterium]MBO7545219.1 biotin/lipoyl-binding protein [Paludibacteraceae bacterium]
MQEFKFKINGADYKCAVEEIEGGLTEVTVNGKKYLVETEKPAAPAPAPKPAAAPAAPKAAPAPAPEPKPAPAPAAKPAAAPAAGVQVKSPLPGSVIKVNVSVGQAVKKGDTLLTLESMKMENPILAEQDGTVAQVAVAAGQTVMQDDLLIVLG